MEIMGWTPPAGFSTFGGSMSKLRVYCQLLALTLILGLLAPALEAAETNTPPRRTGARRPNIVLIVADDLGYGDLGAYGQRRIKTPNLDRLAAEGTRFTSFYAGSTVCAPSRCALMTGLHTGHARIRGNANVPLEPDDVTVAKVLQNAGYYTGLIGKWGLGREKTTGVPEKQGFNEYFGYLDQTHAHDYYPTHLWRYEPRTGFNDAMQLPENYANAHKLYSHDLFTKAALNFIRINKPDQFNQYRPFFLYLAYTIPHANNEEGKASGNGMQVPSDAPYSSENWPQPEKNKAAMISLLDLDVGRIMAKLEERYAASNTIVIFTSDNGPHKEGGVDPNYFQSSGGLRGYKRSLHEGGIRVPMIVWAPGRVPAGRVSDQPWAAWDLLPTLAEVADAEVPKNIDGISMWPELRGKAQTNQHSHFYWEFHERGSAQAVRLKDWKAIRPGPGQPVELYDLKSDLGETNNVAAKNSNIVAQVEAILKEARTESEHWPLKPAPSEDDKKKK